MDVTPVPFNTPPSRTTNSPNRRHAAPGHAQRLSDDRPAPRASPASPPPTTPTDVGSALEQTMRVLVADEVRRLLAAEPQQPAGRFLTQRMERPAATAQKAMSADDVADFLGVDRKTVYDYANRGEIPHRKLGKRLLFSRQALVAWLSTWKGTSSQRGHG